MCFVFAMMSSLEVSFSTLFFIYSDKIRRRGFKLSLLCGSAINSISNRFLMSFAWKDCLAKAWSCDAHTVNNGYPRSVDFMTISSSHKLEIG